MKLLVGLFFSLLLCGFTQIENGFVAYAYKKGGAGEGARSSNLLSRVGTIADSGYGALRAQMHMRAGVEFYDDFSRHHDGVLNTSNSNHSYIVEGTHGSYGVIANSRLVAYAPKTRVATYTQVRLSASGIRVGARFVFGRKTGNGGAAAFGFWSSPMDSSTITVVEDSPCHFTISSTGWTLGTFKNGKLDVRARGAFAKELITDGVTEYIGEVVIDREGESAYIFIEGPNGVLVAIQKVRSNDIGRIDGSVVFFEHFRTADTQALPEYLEVWADSKNKDAVGVAASRWLSVRSPLQRFLGAD